MNHLVCLDAGAGELEKILSGTKTMIVKECEPASDAGSVSPGDSLYFLRSRDECALRAKATVVRVLFCTSDRGEGPAQTLKEMQARLQLTEDQYNHWSAQKQAVLVEFGSAQKIGVIHVAPHKTGKRSDWTACADLSLDTE